MPNYSESPFCFFCDFAALAISSKRKNSVNRDRAARVLALVQKFRERRFFFCTGEIWDATFRKCACNVQCCLLLVIFNSTVLPTCNISGFFTVPFGTKVFTIFCTKTFAIFCTKNFVIFCTNTFETFGFRLHSHRAFRAGNKYY